MISGFPFDDEADAARQNVARLESQAEELRAELLKLHQDVARVRRDFSGMQAVQLLEANEQLVVAALHAETIAETSAGNLTEMTRRGQYDSLTETPNRLLMFDRMTHAIALAHRRGMRLAVLFVDLNNFKQINDTHGHAAGDQALKLAAGRLQSVLRESDTVSRHGGDAFVVLLPEIGNAGDAGISAGKMLSALSAPSRVGDAVIQLNASIGIASFPEDGEDPATLIAAADAAMYRAKQRGRGGFSFHERMSVIESGAPSPVRVRPGSVRPHHAIAADHGEFQLRDLREANENLMLSALTARDEQAKSEAKQRRQAGLLAIMAHELRNPMAPIRSVAGLLRSQVKDETLIAQAQGVIERPIDSMSGMLDDLIDGADARKNHARLDRRPAELADILRMAAEMCRLAIDSRHQLFLVDLPAEAVHLYADVSRLVQVFCNLLDNASKYTPAHGHISLSAVTQGLSAVITVTDSGAGIEPESLTSIFDLGSMRGRLTAHFGAGQGVGLAVVIALVSAHNGTVIGRSSGKDLGSQFVVRLPLHPQSHQAAPEPHLRSGRRG